MGAVVWVYGNREVWVKSLLVFLWADVEYFRVVTVCGIMRWMDVADLLKFCSFSDFFFFFWLKDGNFAELK